MDELAQYTFLLREPVVWCIFIVSLTIYALLLDLSYFRPKDALWHDASHYWRPVLKTMLAALPLLGLLGTIRGLMETFARISQYQSVAQEELISGGIATAMLTTQLGLVTVIPGALMLAYLNSLIKSWEAKHKP